MSIPREPVHTGVAKERRLRQTAADRILALAPHLGPNDRALIEQVYRHGQSLAEVGRAAGVPAGRLQRRLARVLQRLRQPLFQFVVASGDMLPRETRATARLVVLEGQSLRRTAARTGLTLHQVRRHMHTVRAYHRLVGLQHEPA
jgi:DNA-directed RNA polymerase specialized sigma24 family protein